MSRRDRPQNNPKRLRSGASGSSSSARRRRGEVSEAAPRELPDVDGAVLSRGNIDQMPQVKKGDRVHYGKASGNEIPKRGLKNRIFQSADASEPKQTKSSRTRRRTEAYGDLTARLRSAEAEAGKVAFGNRAAFADWAGTHRSQITRLAQGQDVGGEPGWRIAGLVSVVLALLEVYEPDAVPGWLQGINPHLNNRRPLDVLGEGDVAKVMAAIQATRVGSFA